MRGQSDVSICKIDDGPINMNLLIFLNRKDTYGDTYELINRKKNILPYYSKIGNCVLLKGILGSQETLW